MSFKSRFLLVGGIFLLGYGLLVWIAGSTLMRVMINGPLYQRVVQDKDVIADILPPPKYIVEPYLLAHQMAAAKDVGALEQLWQEFQRARALYEARHAYWLDRLRGDLEAAALTRELSERSHQSATRFFEVVEQELRPLLLDRERLEANRAAAAALLGGRLDALFTDHKASVEKAVQAAEALVARHEREAADAVEQGRTRALVVSLLFLGVVALVSFLILRSVLHSLRHITERMRTLAEADADLSARLGIATRDEVGALARWIDAFVEKIGALVRAVKKSSISLRSTATEMAATSHEQEATVSSFGAATTQIAAAVKEISATGSELVATMGEVAQVARDSAQIAAQGKHSLADMQASMQTLAQSSGSISGRLEAINVKARDITGVVTTITKVADQTNLLSVNAAIEAEKAGEYGRGFLVVAREIRRLADQTASATLDIEQTVQQMQAAVSAGVMEMDKFAAQVRRSVDDVEGLGGKLGQIIERVEVLTDRFGSVSEGMTSQNVGARQINDAMSGLTENVKATARSLSEFTQAAEEMKAAVEGLKGELSRFRLEE